MNIVLFCSGSIGFQVVQHFSEKGKKLTCLILDSKLNGELNTRITEIAGISPSNVIYSDNIDEKYTSDLLRNMNLDLGILAWWPYIVKENLIKIPRLGILNFHPSLLPYNRGRNYNFWSIVEDVPFGVSLHWISKAVDCGDIAYQSEIEKTWEDNGKTLYFRSQEKIMDLFKRKFDDIVSGTIPRIPQDLEKGSFHKANELEEASRIDLDKSYRARDLINILRARTFLPHPGAWFIDNGRKYEVRIEIKGKDIG